MSKIKETLVNWGKQPVIQFMMIGLVMFLVNIFIIQAKDIDNEVEYKVYLTAGEVNSMQKTWLSKWQRPPTEMEMEGMINQRIEETILFREAVKIGLNKDDDIIRQRMAQKLEFLTNDLTKPDSASTQEIQDYFELNVENYTIPENITFTQLFVNPKIHGDLLQKEVKTRLKKLNRLGISSNKINKYGDQFSLQTYFPEKSLLELSKLFGVAFSSSVFELETEKWVGPVNSQYGVHLVYISGKTPAAIQNIEAVKELVIEDLQREKQEKLNSLYIDGILSRYTVIIEDED